MKHTIKILLMAIVMVVSATSVFAQQSTPRRSTDQKLSREQLAVVEANHIAQELAFSNAVTTQFVATYCDYKKEIWALGPRPSRNHKGATEQEKEQSMKQRFEMSEKILHIREKYYKKYSQFLSQAQIEKVYEQEHKIMERHAKRASQKPSPRKRK